MNKIKEIITNLKSWQKLVIGILLFTIIGFTSIIMMKPDTYQVLYSDLTPESSTEIIKELSKMGVEYKSEENGTIIKVDGVEAASIRMRLASVGIPGERNPGFELFDQNSLGATKDEKAVKYKRALKGQLENDLVQGIDVVNRATVTLEFTDTGNLFLEDEKQSKATVILGIEGGKALTESQIKGIQNLVSAGVPGMVSEEVVILDEKGNMVSDLSSDLYAGNSNKQSDITAQTENRIKNDILKEMSSMFGYNNVNVTVRARINFDEIVQNIEKYDPTGTLASKQTSKQDAFTVDGNTVIEPGTEGNGDVPEYNLEELDGQTVSRSQSEEVIENWEIGKTIETVKKNPSLTYLSVSISVDEELTPADIAELEEHVAVSAGLIDTDEAGKYENGKVKVTSFTFKQNTSTDFPIVEEKENEAFEFTPTIIAIIAGVLLLLIGMIIFFIVMARRNREKLEKERRLEAQMRLAREREEQNQNLENNLNKAAEPEEDDEDEEFAEDPKEVKRRQSLIKEASEAAEENPKRTAEYISKLINEG